MQQLNLFGSRTTSIVGKGQSVHFPIMTPLVTSYMMPLYDNFNQKTLDEKTSLIEPLKYLSNLVYEVFGQNLPSYDIVPHEEITLKDDTNDVVLGFSGGLDSCYQALLLKDAGYNVHLFHVSGVHAYEGLSEIPAVFSFAEKNDMDLIIVKWKRNNKKDNKYRQQWGDNAIKNQLIEAMMIDYCAEMGWNKVSIGEDNSYSIYRSDVMLGTNVTDCKEVQTAFEQAVKQFVGNVQFMLIERPTNSQIHNKFERLKLLKERGLIDDYYSCVGAGRFNKYNHDVNEIKYDVKLTKYNCGCACTKCALHNLVMHYGGLHTFPQPFIDKCWERLNKTAYNNMTAMFGLDIPIEQRVQNILTY